ncbi:hypothetical protein OF83DRAFT_1104352 [Amylostereum chailletii]|nr:hypothetical protein OF83DRAFT_1104352 [Amylostereum chailletii]
MQEQGGDTPPRSSLPATVHPHLLGSPQDSTDDEAGLQERGYQGMNYTSPSPSGSYTLRPVVPAYYPPHRRGPSLPPLRRDAPFEHGTPLEDISQDRLRMYATPPPGPYASPMRQGGSGPWSTSPGYQPYTPIHPLRLVSPQNVDWDEGEAGPSTWAGGARESEYSELPQADDGWENRWGRQMGSRTGPTESYTRGEASGQARYANPRLHTPPRQASTYDWRSPQDHPDNFARPSYFTQPQPMGTGHSPEQHRQSSFGSAGSSSEGSSFRSQPRELYQAPNYPYDSPQHVEPRLPLGIPPHGSGEDYLPSLSYGRPMPPGYLEHQYSGK